jgi:hypothetical protein
MDIPARIAPPRTHNTLILSPAKEDQDIALSSGGDNVERFLGQFSGDERIDATLRIMASAATSLSTELGADNSAQFYAYEVANRETLERLGKHRDTLSWLLEIADIGQRS